MGSIATPLTHPPLDEATVDITVELYAQGESGRLAPRAVPWGDLVGPNTGLLEALYRNRHQDRPLDVGDVVRVPGVGRYVVLSQGWVLVPRDWAPPLGLDRKPLADDTWQVPPGSHYLHPQEGRAAVPPLARQPQARRRP